MKRFNILLALIKHKVSISVCFTAITGYIIFTKSIDFELIWLTLGVFLMASGCSALNQYQESDFDAKMERTCNRPIPTKQLTEKQALIISLLLLIAGVITLYYALNPITALLGIVNIIWYNLIYTKLKRITPFAVVPGSLVGAIPILMGWTGAGGYVFDQSIVFIAFFLFIWQIPHFWLLMVKYGKQYESAGYPTINQSISPYSLKIIIFTWTIATSLSSIMVPLFSPNIGPVFFTTIFILNLLFIGIFVKLAFAKEAEINFRKSFININVYMLLFMLTVIVFHLV